jgi:hypothetical protein
MGRLLAIVFLLVGGVPVEASPIVRRDWSGADRSTINEWSRYLLAGRSVWGRLVHPPVTRAIEASIWKSLRTDPVGADPMIRFLLWKLEIAPHRFAHDHPRLAPILTRMTRTPIAPQQLVPPAWLPPPTITPGNASPPSVPEPATFLLALGMTTWAAWWGCRRRARARAFPAVPDHWPLTTPEVSVLARERSRLPHPVASSPSRGLW